MSDRNSTGSADAVGGPGAALLVVEDFAPLRVLLARVLGAEGHRITAVETASAALDASSTTGFDLLVTDVALPGGNGADLARSIAAGRPGLRVLFVSGGVQADLDLQVPGALTDFLQKPFDIEELVERVQGLLGAADADAAADAWVDADPAAPWPDVEPADAPAQQD